jgi:hypothetical protein
VLICMYVTGSTSNWILNATMYSTTYVRGGTIQFYYAYI